MNNTVDKVIKIAEAEVGYLEKKSNSNLDSKTENAGSANYTKYARDIDTKYPNFYNGKKNGFAWCDVFVDWCFIQAYGVDEAKKLLCQKDKSLGASCTYSAKYYEANGQLVKTPKVGDQIFFKGSDGKPCHTGLVYKVDAKNVYTIEGNTSKASGVVANGGGVAKKSYALAYNKIYGYGRPKYDVEEVKETKPQTTTSSNVDKFDATYRSGKSYKVNATNGLNIRKGAGVNTTKIATLANGTVVTWYGYYREPGDGKVWKYVKVASGSHKGVVGYVSSGYLS